MKNDIAKSIATLGVCGVAVAGMMTGHETAAFLVVLVGSLAIWQ